MRLVPLLVFSSTVLGSAAVAASPRSAVSPAITASFRATLHAMVPPGQTKHKVDRDQGDDNASLRAISVVCSHDNPSATRSAICPIPVSPD